MNSAKPFARNSAAPAPFRSRCDDDDVRTRQLVAAGDSTPDEGAVVDEHLQVQLGRQPTRVAVAGRRLVDAPEPAPEGEVGSLDRVEQQGPVGAPVLDEQERRVALELDQSERRLEAADDRLQEVTGDGRRVLDLAPGEVRGVAGQIGEDQEASLGCRCHVVNRRPWSRSNVNTQSPVDDLQPASRLGTTSHPSARPRTRWGEPGVGVDWTSAPS